MDMLFIDFCAVLIEPKHVILVEAGERRSRGSNASRTFACFAPGSGRDARGSGRLVGLVKTPASPDQVPKTSQASPARPHRAARGAPPASSRPGAHATPAARHGMVAKAPLGTLEPAVPARATHQKPRRA